jgi:hypothetical protein
MVTAGEVPHDGLNLRIVATPEERAKLAAGFDLLAVARFEAELHVRPFARTGLHVTGRVRALIEQTCVVTLEPVENAVDEPVDVKLVPESEAHKWLKPPSEDDDDLDSEREDPPDLFDGSSIDVGAIATEHFALGIDPYPRKPGAVFDAEAFGVAPPPDEAPVSPFAALAQLKKD